MSRYNAWSTRVSSWFNCDYRIASETLKKRARFKPNVAETIICHKLLCEFVEMFLKNIYEVKRGRKNECERETVSDNCYRESTFGNRCEECECKDEYKDDIYDEKEKFESVRIHLSDISLN